MMSTVKERRGKDNNYWKYKPAFQRLASSTHIYTIQYEIRTRKKLLAVTINLSIWTCTTAPTRFDSSHNSSTGFVHSFINVTLILCELAIGWKWTCDVRCIAVVLSTHVKQAAKAWLKWFGLPLCTLLNQCESHLPSSQAIFYLCVDYIKTTKTDFGKVYHV